MSVNIWTQCAASFEKRSLRATGFRIVEDQSRNSTRKLVDSDAEQALLETLIDRVKPPVPPEIAARHLHYLYFTPFRHPPLPWGSRFGTVHQRGIFYGSLELPTVLAEVAYYRMVFLEGSDARLDWLTTVHSAFRFEIRAQSSANLTEAPFDRFEKEISSKVSYTASHLLGQEMRGAGIEAFLFSSARARSRGTNIGLLEPVFADRAPSGVQGFACHATKALVEFKKSSHFASPVFSFPRADFLVNGQLPLAR